MTESFLNEARSDPNFARTSLNFPGCLDALRCSMKRYYIEYLDGMDNGEIWFAPTEGPTVPLAYFFNSRVVLHATISQSAFLEWGQNEEVEE